MKKGKTLLIINPISGGRKKSVLPDLMKRHLDKAVFGEAEVIVSEYAGHSPVIAEKAIANEFDTIIIAGGDGTINEVGSKLAGTDVRLGIIPFGSGNGLARHLKIPLLSVKALQCMNKNKVLRIDAGMVNDRYFFCTSGLGFDAWIGYLFATSKKRGFWTYVTTALREFYRYKPENYEITVNGETKNQIAFLVTMANAAQYGSDAVIAPTADVTDGKLDLCLLTPFPKFRAAEIGMRLFNKSIDQSVYLTTTKTTAALIKRKNAGIIHLDGEPMEMGDELKIKVIPSCLNILIP
jgi:diacylglycerol kinase (ATP)